MSRIVKLGWYREKYCAVHYDESGCRKRHSLGTADRILAKTRLAAFKTSLSAKTPEQELTVGAIFAAYLQDRALEEKSTERMSYAWKRLGPHFGHLRPVDLTKNEGRDYITKRRAQGASDGTIWTELVYLRAALQFAVTEKWLTAVPYVPTPQKPAPRSHHLAKDEVQKIIDAAAWPHIKLFIRLAVATAGRASAILDLTWDRVNFDLGLIDLYDPSQGRTRKGRAVVPINKSLYVALVEAKRAAASDYVIEWGGDRVNSVKKGIREAARRAGIEASPHVFRHTAAVWMAQDGVSMAKIAQYLGHEDDRTTQRVYARFSPEYQRDAAEALEL